MRTTRWILRLESGAIVLLIATSLIAYCFLRPVPPHENTPIGWLYVPVFILAVCWLLYYWYLSDLSYSLADKPLSKIFYLIWCLGVLVMVPCLVMAGWAYYRGVPLTSATAPAGTRAESSGGSAFVFFIALFGLAGCLMWWLSRRLNRCARHYRTLVGQPPTDVSMP